MTLAEIYEGAARAKWGAKRFAELMATLEDYVVLPSTIECCWHWQNSPLSLIPPGSLIAISTTRPESSCAGAKRKSMLRNMSGSVHQISLKSIEWIAVAVAIERGFSLQKVAIFSEKRRLVWW